MTHREPAVSDKAIKSAIDDLAQDGNALRFVARICQAYNDFQRVVDTDALVYGNDPRDPSACIPRPPR